LEEKISNKNVLDVIDIVKCYPSRYNFRERRRNGLRQKTISDLPVASNRATNRAGTVLAGINLHLAVGDKLALVGQSAAGKSTLAKIILGLEKPSSGEVFYYGEKLIYHQRKKKDPALEKIQTEVSLILQDPRSSFDPRMSIFSSVSEPLLSTKKIFNDKDKVAKALSKAGIDSKYFARYPHQLSGGQLQRAAIARAIVSEPKFLIADEMVSALDPSRRKEILDLLIDAISEEMDALIFIAHDLSAAKYLCNKIAIIHNGKIVEYGDIHNILENPKDTYTKQLIYADKVLSKT